MKKTNPLSVDTIASLTIKLRKEYNVKEDEAFPILEYLAHLHSDGLVSMQILENDDPYFDSKTVAKYNAIDNFIYLKESVIYDYENGIFHSAFTLAHELFHFIQTHVLNFVFEEVESCKAYEDSEWQANEFAGELLVPRKYVHLDEKEIAQRFKVSIECALTRKLKYKQRNEKKFA